MLADGRINPNQIGVYLHWNGGRTCIEAFLKYCELKQYRTPDTDCYGWARLCQVIGNFFGGGLSLGIDCAMNLDCANYDNGTYVIENWEIVGRLHLEHSECYADYSVNDMLKEIDKRMPESERLGEGFFDAEEVAAEELQVGDTVFVFDTDSHCYSPRVVNITPDKVYFDGAMSGSIDLKRGLMPQMVRRLPKS
nr:MAG TPA: hypothetical protein [Caudoviricetes sp.]